MKRKRRERPIETWSRSDARSAQIRSKFFSTSRRVMRSITGRPCGQTVEYSVARSSSRMWAIFSTSADSWPSPRRGTRCGGDPLQRLLDARPRSSPSRSSASARSAASQSSRRKSAGTADTLTLSPPNSSTSKPKRSSVRAARPAPVARRRRSSSTHRHQQPLALERPRRQPLHDPLEQHALVRDVLVDDRNALVVHGDDEGVAELPQRNQRPHDGRDRLWRRRVPVEPPCSEPVCVVKPRRSGRASTRPCSGSSGWDTPRPRGPREWRGIGRPRMTSRAAASTPAPALPERVMPARGGRPRARATARGSALPPWSDGR